MIAEAVIAPKRPESDVMLEHVASEEIAVEMRKNLIDLAELSCSLSLLTFFFNFPLLEINFTDSHCQSFCDHSEKFA